MSHNTNSLLLKNLIDFGLSEKEALVYLALLELEIAPVQEVAKTAGVNRSSTYVVLESLKKKGLVGISDDKNIQQYVAASPELLLHTLEQKVKKQEAVLERMNEIIPELKALHKDTKHKPKVRVFEGKDAIKNIYFDLFSSDVKDIRVFANPANIFSVFPDFAKHDLERSKRNIRLYAINPATKEVLDIHKHIPAEKNSEFMFIPPEKYNFSSDMGIYGDKISFISTKEKFGFILESREIADMLRGVYDLLWEEAKRLDKKIKR